MPNEDNFLSSRTIANTNRSTESQSRKSIDRALWKAEGFVKSSSVDTTPSTRIDVDEDEEEILRTGVGEEQQQLVVFFFNDTADAAEEGQETRNFARENMLRASRFFLPFCAAKKESKVSNCFSFPRTKRLHHPLLNERLEGRHERVVVVVVVVVLWRCFIGRRFRRQRAFRILLLGRRR